MNQPIWLLPEAVLAMHGMLLAAHGGLPGLRDPGLLESALARPRNLWHYQPESSLFALAASYAFALVHDHPFLDGNKRIALTASAVFLEINGLSLDAPEAETALLFEQLAAGEITEEALARWMKHHARLLGS
ncbi:MAG TPA: type II toxin-antitoxin system death-on-curing family toxin [Gammaproteobacteria bacterium]|nr:type II toxin-antitoxin system death-on-curing family toxin [Gammaproteobacteria bacterium]